MTKKEMDLLLGVLKRYVDTCVLEWFSTPDKRKDPSDLANSTWHAFELLYMEQFKGNNIPITHTVFREFLHWLDDACQRLEQVLKGYCDTKIDEKFATILLATRLNVFKKAEDGKYYIEMLDQHNDRMGNAQVIPMTIIETEDLSGLTVEFFSVRDAYKIALKTGGTDTRLKRYLNIDADGAYIKSDRLTPVQVEGKEIATYTRGDNDESVSIKIPHPFVPLEETFDNEDGTKIPIGTYGDEMVYEHDERATLEGHYDPKEVSDTQKKSIFEEASESVRVITDLKVDPKGHLVGYSYAEVNEDGTIGETTDVDIVPEEPETTLYSGTIKIVVKEGNTIKMTFTKAYNDLASGTSVDLTSLKNNLTNWVSTNNYIFEGYANNITPSDSIVITADTGNVEYIANVKSVSSANEDVTVTLKLNYNNTLVHTINYTPTESDGYVIGRVIDPTQEQEKTNQLVSAWVTASTVYDSYEFETDIIRITENTILNVNLHKPGDDDTPSAPSGGGSGSSEPATVTLSKQDLDGTDITISSADLTDLDNGIAKTYDLPNIGYNGFPISVYVQPIMSEQNEQIVEKYWILLQTNGERIVNFGDNGNNVEVSITMSDDTTGQVDLSKAEYNSGIYSKGTFIMGSEIDSINIRYVLNNITIKQ